MNLKIFLGILLCIMGWGVVPAQQVCITVSDVHNAPMMYSGVRLEQRSKTIFSALTDSLGKVCFSSLSDTAVYKIYINYPGHDNVVHAFRADTATLLRIVLRSAEDNTVTISYNEVTKEQSPIPVEVYSATYFKKNPTPNIFEALSIVNGIQPQLNCNVCNTGDIHINGLEGPYTMVTIDGMPIVSGLATVYGFSGIPNSMIRRVEVVKGPASTLYGSEAVGGLINIVTRSAADAPKFAFDYFTTTYGEHNLDLSTSLKTKKANMLLGVNGFGFNRRWDVNNDNFTDVTLQKRFSVFNKWEFVRKDSREASIAFRWVRENRFGGEMQWTPQWAGTDSIYGETIHTNRQEMLGLYRLPFGGKQKLYLSYSLSNHEQRSYYGTMKYDGNQTILFTQLYWLGHLAHNVRMTAGLPLRYTYYDDNTPATAVTESPTIIRNKADRQWLPGVFAQAEWDVTPKVTLLGGYRVDRHSAHGLINTPRVSLKYAPNDYTQIRLTAGSGYRVVNLFTEDHASLTGAREVVITEELKPERSWNSNLNIVRFINLKGDAFIRPDVSFFYTHFMNRIIPDYITNDALIIYDNLKGFSVSRGMTINIEAQVHKKLRGLLGATFMDVFITEADANGEMKTRKELFAPNVSGTFALTYTLPKAGMYIDLTGKLNGPMQLPVQENDFRPETSPWFCLMNVQATKYLWKRTEVYAGVKNLLNFIPQHPIIRPFDPFDKNIAVNNPNGYVFDPSYNYAAVQGLRVFVGLRWTLN